MRPDAVTEAAARIVESVEAAAARYSALPEQAEPLAEAALRRRSWRLKRGGKTCSSCGKTKRLSEFGADATRPDGLEPRCRECRRRRSDEP